MKRMENGSGIRIESSDRGGSGSTRSVRWNRGDVSLAAECHLRDDRTSGKRLQEREK